MRSSVLPFNGWSRHAWISKALCVVLALGAAAVVDEARAGSATWSSTNIQYLYGTSHERIEFDPEAGLYGVEESRSVITVEHVNEWKYGDNFLFFDITNPDRGDAQTPTSIYGEISPRLSFAKMTGKKLSRGLFKDVLLTGTLVFPDTNPMSMALKHVQAPPDPPSQRTELPIPRELDDLVMACLEKDPDKRPQDAERLFEMACHCGSSEAWDNAMARHWWETNLIDLTGPLTLTDPRPEAVTRAVVIQ